MRRGPPGLTVAALLVAAALGSAALLSAAAGAVPVDWARARLITVVTREYRFVPNHLVFRRGLAYRLHVVNRGHELHELTAPEFFKTLEWRGPAALNRDGTELVLQPGEQQDLYFVAPRPGRYDMRCADHDWAGMTGDITVR
jgi:uncharacterized cupredoxin-like copper-binding protein